MRDAGFVLRAASGSIVPVARLVTRRIAGFPVSIQGQVNQMVTRRIGGAAAPTFRSPLVAALLLSVSVCAQDPQPASSPQPAGAPPQGEAAPPAVEVAPQDAEPVYGKVLGESVQLRCWPAEVAGSASSGTAGAPRAVKTGTSRACSTVCWRSKRPWSRRRGPTDDVAAARPWATGVIQAERIPSSRPRRVKAAMAWSICASECAAESCTRMRACPFGTTG